MDNQMQRWDPDPSTSEEPFEVVCDSDDRASWLAARHTLVGASDIAAVLGIDPYESALELYLRKRGMIEEDAGSEASEMGLRLEPVIADLYRERTGRPVERAGTLIRSRRYPWLGCTLDGWTEVPGQGRIPLELKTVGFMRAPDWNEGVPPYYAPQGTGQGIVTGSPLVSWAVLIGGQKFAWADLALDPAVVALVIEAARDFMRRVDVGDAPAPDGSESAARALFHLYPQQVADKTITLDGAAVAWSDRLAALDATIKDADAERDSLRNALKAVLQDAERGVLPGGGSWTWRQQARKAVTCPACAHEVSPGSTFRVLRRGK